MNTKSASAKKMLEKIIGPLTFGMVLRAYMDREDINQSELAERLGVTVGYISNIVNERKKVSIPKALEIAEILDEPRRTYLEAAIEDSLRENGVACRVELRGLKV